MQEIATTLKMQAAKRLLAAALLSVPLLCIGPPALAQTNHSGSGTPQSGGTVAPPKGAATDKGTYTTVDTVGRKAAGTIGTYGNTREMQDGNAGSVQDTTRSTPRSSTSTQGNRTGSYGNTGTAGPRPRQDTTGREGGLGNTGTNPSRNGAAGDTLSGGDKASYESGSRTNNGSQLNSNRTRQSGSGKKQ